MSQCVLCHWFSSKISQIWCSADTLPFAPKGQLRYFKNLNCMHLIDACIFIQNITIFKEHVFFTALLFGGKLYLYRTVSGDMLSFYYLNRRYFVVCIQGVFVSGFVLKSLCGHWVQTCSLPESPIPRFFLIRNGAMRTRNPSGAVLIAPSRWLLPATVSQSQFPYLTEAKHRIVPEISLKIQNLEKMPLLLRSI